MSKIHNISLLKIARALSEDGPKLLELFDKQYNELLKYSIYAPVRTAILTIKESKELLKDQIKVANKVKNSKGRIK